MVLELHYWEGMSAADLSDVVAIRLGTAKTWLREAVSYWEERLCEVSASAVLHSTLANLDAWATKLRVHVLGDDEG